MRALAIVRGLILIGIRSEHGGDVVDDGSGGHCRLSRSLGCSSKGEVHFCDLAT